MKIFKNILFAGVMSCLCFSCSDDSEDDLIPVAPVDPIDPVIELITYTNNVKSIIDNNCVVCHQGVDPAGGLYLRDYNEVKSAVLNNGLLNRINDAANPMPQGGLLPQSIRDIIDQWNTDGLLE